MIHRSVRALVALLAGALFFGSATVALGHGESVTVQPTSAKAGDTVTITGAGLGASRDVDITLSGTGVTVKLGHADSDADGAFTEKFKLPADLRPGQYLITAEGKETATADLTIVAGVAQGDEMSGASMSAVFQPRERPFEQVLALVVVFGMLSGLGLFLARFGGGTRTAPEERTAMLPGAERA